MQLTDFLLAFGGKDEYVKYYPQLCPIMGGASPTLFICLFIGWTGNQKDPDGWIYKSQADITRETGLTRAEQETARRELKRRGLLDEKKKGIPCQLYYRPNRDRINIAWENFRKSQEYQQIAENQQTSLRENDKQGRGKPANKVAGNPHATPYTTTCDTTEDTTEFCGPEAKCAHPSRASRQHSDSSRSLQGPPPPKQKTKPIEPPDDSPSFIAFPLNDGSNYDITEKMVAEWEELFPAIDVRQVLRNQKAWLIANEENRKTRSGVLKFVTKWLMKDQNNAPRRSQTEGVTVAAGRPSFEQQRSDARRENAREFAETLKRRCANGDGTLF